jgi:hypothetical protein
MTSTFKKRFRKLALPFVLLFIAMFLLRLLYGYLATSARHGDDHDDNFFSSLNDIRRNYASEKIVMKNNVQLQSNIASTQKFEKTATIKTRSTEFEKDEKLIKDKTKAFNAVIQYEQNLGQKSNRQLHLLIGVSPQLFDSFHVALQQIGALKGLEITKVDKTNEFRQLNAKKASIEKTLQSLNDLKAKGGEIADFVTLNDKILEVEEKLQELGVELGNFDTENEFCTVKLSLYEGAIEKGVPFIQRIRIAVEWTITYYAVLVVSILALTVLIFLMLVVVDKLKLINAVSRKLSE